jgi:hypothetical protein
MLAAQMQKSADKAVTAISVIIRAARPVVVASKGSRAHHAARTGRSSGLPRRSAFVKGFRTPASVHVLAPVTGRRPKTLNESGCSPAEATQQRPQWLFLN